MCKEIQPVHSEGDQPWDFFGRNDAKAETLVLWPPHAKSWLIGKDSDAGRDWGQEKKETTEDEMAGWHHRLNGHEFEWTPGVGDGQGGLACCDSWGHKELDTTEWLNWTEFAWNVPLVSLIFLKRSLVFPILWNICLLQSHILSNYFQHIIHPWIFQYLSLGDKNSFFPNLIISKFHLFCL